ncbi:MULTISPECIES: AlpA family transcriptional regulator [Pseudomonas]|uniref:helix-turn-helix transcriptional regulator n=1 Tax=Pseudomonas TaxID=286 RepID=UPI0013A773FD|nr:helix-turn-helix domain-containing protein [Pseudomonas sp. OIL-1]QIB51523.1 helix-turn-helix domain-containing protein [Pseudomonas sp. OIL-1]
MFFTVKEVAERYKVNASTIWRWQRKDKFPKPKKIEGVTRWTEKMLEAYDEALEDTR